MATTQKPKRGRAKKVVHTETVNINNRFPGAIMFAGVKNLNEEYLRPFKADLFLTLDSLHAGELEARHLIAKLKAGEVDGSTYGHNDKTECACLVGTIAQVGDRRVDELDRSPARPAERWFMMINRGDKPGAVDSEGKPTGGGYAAQKVVEWLEDWAACHGVDLTQAVEA